MKYKFLFYFFIMLISIISYPQDKNFEVLYDNIIKNIKSKNYSVLDKYIHPEYGLYFVFQGSGISEEIVHSKKSQALFEDKNNKELFALSGNGKMNFLFNKVPDYSCENEEWDVNGICCLEYKKGGEFKFENSYMYNAELYEPTKSFAKSLYKIKCDYILVSTYEDFAMYFKKVKDKYYLVCIHFLSYCSA